MFFGETCWLWFYHGLEVHLNLSMTASPHCIQVVEVLRKERHVEKKRAQNEDCLMHRKDHIFVKLLIMAKYDTLKARSLSKSDAFQSFSYEFSKKIGKLHGSRAFCNGGWDPDFTVLTWIHIKKTKFLLDPSIFFVEKSDCLWNFWTKVGKYFEKNSCQEEFLPFLILIRGASQKHHDKKRTIFGKNVKPDFQRKISDCRIENFHTFADGKKQIGVYGFCSHSSAVIRATEHFIYFLSVSKENSHHQEEIPAWLKIRE